MAIGVSRKRDDRRRRVLRDERPGEEEGGDAVRRRSSRRVRLRYGAAARRRHQPAIVDLLPLSVRSFWLASIGLLLTTAAIVALVWNLLQSQTVETADSIGSNPFEQTNALGLAARLSQWCAVGLCLATSVVAFQIFLVRRHRRDDYQGHYTVWLWSALAIVLASAELSASVVDSVTELALASWAPAWNASWIAIAVRLSLGLALGARLAWEMREHLPSTIALMALVPFVVGFELVPLWLPGTAIGQLLVACEGIVLATGSMFALLWHARYVVIDAAQGGGGLSEARAANGAEVDGSGEGDDLSQEPVSRKRGRTSAIADEPAGEPEKVARSKRVNARASEDESESKTAVTPTSAKGAHSSNAAASSPAPVSSPAKSPASVSSTPVAATPNPATPVSATPAPSASIHSHTTTSSQAAPEPDEEDDDDAGMDEQSMAGMSKAQRKKLAKMQRRAARRDAA